MKQQRLIIYLKKQVKLSKYGFKEIFLFNLKSSAIIEFITCELSKKITECLQACDGNEKDVQLINTVIKKDFFINKESKKKYKYKLIDF